MTFDPKGLKRGDVVWVDLRGAMGGEQLADVDRPAVIVSNDRINALGRCVIVMPISSVKGRALRPTEALIRAGDGGLKKDSFAIVDQIRTIDIALRIRRVAGHLSELVMMEIEMKLLLATTEMS